MGSADNDEGIVLTIEDPTFGSAVITVAPELWKQLQAIDQRCEAADLADIFGPLLEAAGVTLRVILALDPLVQAGHLDADAAAVMVERAVNERLGFASD
ncbi:MAG: hypothetical protein ACM3KF_04210 [Acidobacteriota bacterium]